MSPMVLFEAVWLQSPARLWRGLEGPLACFLGLWPGFGTPDSPEGGPWERSWEALLEALGKAHLQRQSKWITFWGSKQRYRGGPVWPAPNEFSRRGEHGL